MQCGCAFRHADDADQLFGHKPKTPSPRGHQGSAGRKCLPLHWLRTIVDAALSAAQAAVAEAIIHAGAVQRRNEFSQARRPRQARGPHALHRRSRAARDAARGFAARQIAIRENRCASTRPKPASMPGVRAVVSAVDAPGMHRHRHRRPSAVRDRTVIRYDGEPIAAIAADTLAQAQAAATAIDRRDRAIAGGPHDGGRAGAGRAAGASRMARATKFCSEGGAREGNVAWEATVVRGDVDAASPRPDVAIVESAFRVGRQNHVVLRAARGGRLATRTGASISKRRPRCPGRSQRHRAPAGCAALAGAGHRAAGRRRLWTEIRLRDRALRCAAGPRERTAGPACNSRQEEMLTCLFRENAEITHPLGRDQTARSSAGKPWC